MESTTSETYSTTSTTKSATTTDENTTTATIESSTTTEEYQTTPKVESTTSKTHPTILTTKSTTTTEENTTTSTTKSATTTDEHPKTSTIKSTTTTEEHSTTPRIESTTSETYSTTSTTKSATTTEENTTTATTEENQTTPKVESTTSKTHPTTLTTRSSTKTEEHSTTPKVKSTTSETDPTTSTAKSTTTTDEHPTTSTIKITTTTKEHSTTLRIESTTSETYSTTLSTKSTTTTEENTTTAKMKSSTTTEEHPKNSTTATIEKHPTTTEEYPTTPKNGSTTSETYPTTLTTKSTTTTEVQCIVDETQKTTIILAGCNNYEKIKTAEIFGKNFGIPDVPFESCHRPGTVFFNNSVVLCGGDEYIETNCIQTKPDYLDWEPFPSLLSQRERFAMASVGNSIVVVGGFKADFAVEIYQNGKWRKGPYFEDARNLIHHCAVGYGEDKVMVIGGYYNYSPTNKVNIIDVHTNEVQHGPSLNKNRYSHSCTKFSMKHEEYIAVAGGFEGYSVSNCVEVMKLCTADGSIPKMQWKIIAPMNIKRHDFGLSVYGKYLAAFGGEPTIDSEKTEVYDPKTNSWRFVDAVLKYKKRHYFSTVAVPASEKEEIEVTFSNHKISSGSGMVEDMEK